MFTKYSPLIVLFALLTSTAAGQTASEQANELTKKIPKDVKNDLKEEVVGAAEEAIGELEDLTADAFKQYAQRLNAILKTRRIEEKDFVDKVVLEVQLGRVPKPLVDSSWTWVRNKRPNTRYPFIYFERVLRLQADKLKIKIPKFDYSIYNTR